MSNGDQNTSGKGRSPAEQRTARLAEQLRANLKRRKEKARAQPQPANDDSQEPPPGGNPGTK